MTGRNRYANAGPQPHDPCPVADVYDAMGERPKSPVIAVEAGGCAPPIIVPSTVADRILQFLRGDVAHDPYQLLRDARAALLGGAQ